MFKGNNDKTSNSKFKTAQVETIVGGNTIVEGNIHFEGGLHIDGKLNGNVSAAPDSNSILILSEHGEIKGDVSVPNVLINGLVTGDVNATQRAELANNAKVNGNVYYALLEMAMGAAINGNMVHTNDADKRLLEHQSPRGPARAEKPIADNIADRRVEMQKKGVINK